MVKAVNTDEVFRHASSSLTRAMIFGYGIGGGVAMD